MNEPKTTDYEAQYLALCAVDERLRRLKPCKHISHHNEHGKPIRFKDSSTCIYCQGRGWLPLPEAERLGALVRVILEKGWECEFKPFWSKERIGIEAIVFGHFNIADTPEAALTAALMAAVAQEPQP